MCVWGGGGGGGGGGRGGIHGVNVAVDSKLKGYREFNQTSQKGKAK